MAENIQISSNFDSGNIEVVSAQSADNIQLKIRKDANANFCQWFHFRVTDVKNRKCTLKIINANECSYPNAWHNYQACASYDHQNWFRVETHFDGKNLIISHTPEFNSVYYAFFAPYSYEQHLALIGKAQQLPYCKVSDLGYTTDHRPITLLTLGDEKTAQLKYWIIARQHAGESMAEWFIEGFLQRLANTDDPVIKSLLSQVVFYMVPNMNPDGSVRGHLRANAKGFDLNRCWQTPSAEDSPEVFYVREKMLETGVDFCLDVHGDEELPYVFLVSAADNNSFTEKQKYLTQTFVETFLQISPDFQTEHGYAQRQFGPQTMLLATNYVADQFDCLSFTLEMPFKDNANLPDKKFGWSPNRAKILAHAVIDALHRVTPTMEKAKKRGLTDSHAAVKNTENIG